MKRVNGYIDLNELDTRFFEKSNYAKSHCWINIGDSSYYYKDTINPYNELVCSELAKMMGLDCVDYDLATLNHTRGVISKSYRKPGAKYVSGKDILKKYYRDGKEYNKQMGITAIDYRNILGGPSVILMNNLETIWQAIVYYYGNSYPYSDIVECINGLVKELIFSLLIGNYDKSSHNWEIELNENRLKLVPIFDNESSLSLEEKRMLMTTSSKDSFHYLTKVTEYFLCTSSSEYIDLFLKMFYSLDDSSIYIAIGKVEKKIKNKIPDYIRNNMIDAYLYNRYLIWRVIKKINIENNLER